MIKKPSRRGRRAKKGADGIDWNVELERSEDLEPLDTPDVDELVGSGPRFDVAGGRSSLPTPRDGWDDEPVDDAELTMAKRLDDAVLAAAGRRRIALLLLAVIVAGGTVAAVNYGPGLFDGDEGGDDLAELEIPEPEEIETEPVVEDPTGPLTIDRFLAAPLDTAVVVAAGDGPRDERIIVAPGPGELPVEPGVVNGALVRVAGETAVLFTGPPGWLEDICLQASVVTTDLETIDAVFHDTPTGACAAQGIGRRTSIPCVGSEAIALGVELPVGVLELANGDRVRAEVIRIAIVGANPFLEVSQVTGRIELPPENEVLSVPAVRAERGEQIEFVVPGDDGPARYACVVQ